jgi:hypothetical protein
LQVFHGSLALLRRSRCAHQQDPSNKKGSLRLPGAPAKCRVNSANIR